MVTQTDLPGKTLGCRAHLKTLNHFGLSPLIAGYTNGECSSNAAASASIASRFWSSICTGSDGSATNEMASCFMIDSALTAGGPSWAAVEAGFRMLPPALTVSVLNQTTVPSYWAPWISIRCGLPCLASCSASLIICAHVFGGVFTRSERYQSSWVLLL